SRASVFVSPHRPDAGRGPGALGCGRPTPLRTGSNRVSHVPGEPSCVCAWFSDPGGTGPSGLTKDRHGPRRGNTEGSPPRPPFRGSIARPRRSLSSLRSSDHSETTPDRFRPPATLYRVGLITHRVPSKGFQDVFRYIPSSFPRLLVTQ